MNDTEELKKAAAQRAAEWIEDGMAVGLGTGSTVRHLLEAIRDRLSRGELPNIIGIPTSEATRAHATECGIPLSNLERHPRLDLAIDGADEVDPALDLIKGLGGALLREKVVAAAAADFIVLVDETKRVDRLGTRAPVPVEIDPFSYGFQLPFLRAAGCDPRLRLDRSGGPFRSDGGHLILDCHFPDAVPDPLAFADRLDARPGVLEHGLFLGMCRRVVVAAATGVELLERR
jgi:ribose 5-phosphate isomerase A